MILLSTFASVWGALPHAATADMCDTLKKITFENVDIKNLSLRFKRMICLQYEDLRNLHLGFFQRNATMEYGHLDFSCSRAPISTSELLLTEHGHPGTSSLCGLW